MLDRRILDYLNQGDTVAVETSEALEQMRSFVRIRPMPNPAIARQERRFINSPYPIWEYWFFEFRRLTLRPGWETDEWNYDRYLVHDERRMTQSEAEFLETLKEWVPAPQRLVHVTKSPCPE